MQKAEFDKFADEYYVLHQKNIRYSGESPEFFAEYKISFPDASLICLDVSEKNLEVGRTCFPSLADFQSFDENTELIRGTLLWKEMQKAGFQSVGLRYRLFLPGALRALRPLEQWLHRYSLGCSIFRSCNQTIGELI